MPPPPKPRSPRGRRASAASLDVPVCVRLTAQQYDRAHAQASRDRTSVPALTRRALSQLLDAADDADDD